MNILIRLFLSIISITFLYSCSPEPFPILDYSEGRYLLTSENLLQKQNHLQKIDSLFNSGTSGYFLGKEDIKIFYKYFLNRKNEKGAIVISSGRTEAVIKYKELIFDFYNNGYSVYIHDHRGQGYSDRMLGDPDMGYVEYFQYYIDDMKIFFDDYVYLNKHKNIYLLAHSMGGAIGVSYIEQYPDDFTAASFSSPMLGLPFPTCLAVSILAGEQPEYAIGNDNYKNSLVTFDENDLTNSTVRYQIMLDVFDANPKAKLGGATYQWVNRSCKQFDYIFNNINQISIPIILFSGEDEQIVSSSAHNEFINILTAMGATATGYLVEGANHELLIEKDSIRTAVLSKTLDFFKQNQK